MNQMLIKLQNDNKETMKKYMEQPNIKHIPPKLNMQSIIKENMESEPPTENRKDNSDEKPKYHPGEIKKNRIKCYREMNHELLKEEERNKRKKTTCQNKTKNYT